MGRVDVVEWVLLAVPAGREVYVPLLRGDGLYDPLRSDPRFDRMTERFSTEEVHTLRQAAHARAALRSPI